MQGQIRSLTHRHLGKNAEITCVGHCDLTEDEQGNWFMVVLGCRPVDGKTFLGRETFLAKVEWEDDWAGGKPGSRNAGKGNLSAW